MKIQDFISLNNAAKTKKKLNTFPPKLRLLRTNLVKEKEFIKRIKDLASKVFFYSNLETSKQE